MSERSVPAGAVKQLAGLHRRESESDAVELLYRYSAGGVLVSLLASSGLAVISSGQVRRAWLFTWWAAITSVLLLRVADILHFHAFRAATKIRERTDTWRFGAGLVATALLWAAFPIAFMGQLDQTGRAYTAIVLSGMTGGSATVLAPSKVFSLVFCALLVLPTSILFLLMPGLPNTFLGVLGCVFFVVMTASSRITNRASMAAMKLSRANAALAGEMRTQRQQSEAVNVELKAAQAELRQANQFLEERIQARTADLEREMEEKERFAKELARLASTDPLTGLSNRTTLAKRLTSAVACAAETGWRVMILFLDLDRFKEVNDVMGHPVGDAVLKAVAGRLSGCLPREVEVARWGGDEFVIVQSGVEEAETALQLACWLQERVREPIELSDPTTGDNLLVTIDATIGIALFPEHGRTQEELIRAADLAMYASKEDKRSKIRLYDSRLSAEMDERHLMERALRDAISSDSLSLVFQPIVTSGQGCCVALEALLRWDHAVKGPISPDVFIPLAERTGEIMALGRWVLTEACREAATWDGEQPPAVAVNVSAAQLTSGTLVADVHAALESSGLAPQRLHLELTERVFADGNNVNPILNELRQEGIKIALDDFGTGFSCLAYLRTLPIDLIKIDKSFVQAIHIDSAPIIETIVITAKTFGLEVVAEGVETNEQAEALLRIGTDYLQGHLFADSQPAGVIRRWIAERYEASANRTMAAGWV